MMKIINLLAEKSRDAYHKRPATIGIIGDSVSKGMPDGPGLGPAKRGGLYRSAGDLAVPG